MAVDLLLVSESHTDGFTLSPRFLPADPGRFEAFSFVPSRLRPADDGRGAPESELDCLAAEDLLTVEDFFLRGSSGLFRGGVGIISGEFLSEGAGLAAILLSLSGMLPGMEACPFGADAATLVAGAAAFEFTFCGELGSTLLATNASATGFCFAGDGDGAVVAGLLDKHPILDFQICSRD